jgi:hypothetical protein
VKGPTVGPYACCVSLIISVGVVASCGSPASTASSTTTLDSAGIRIVLNSGDPNVEAPWRIAPEPIFRRGWGQEGPEFERLGLGFLRTDGSVVVSDGGANLLHSFSPSGELLLSFGGEGEGPGEFRRISGLVPLGQDSILVSDQGNARVSVFAGGRYLSGTSFSSFFANAIYDPAGRSASGGYALIPTSFMVGALEDGITGWRDFPVLATGDFSAMDTLAQVGLFKTLQPGNRNPIRHRGHIAFSEPSFTYARTDEPEVTWMNHDGVVSQVARWEVSGASVNEEDWAAYEAGVRARSDPDSDQQRLEQRLRDQHQDFGGTKPMFRSLHNDHLANVWLGGYDLSRRATLSFAVVSVTGEWLGWVRFPREIHILDIGADRVLGVETNELDVQSIVVYQIEKLENH